MVLWIVQVSCQVQSYWDGQDESPENVRRSSSSYWVGIRYTSVSIITSCYSNGSISRVILLWPHDVASWKMHMQRNDKYITTYMVSGKKRCSWFFCNNFVKFWPISILLDINLDRLIFNTLLCSVLATPIVYKPYKWADVLLVLIFTDFPTLPFGARDGKLTSCYSNK